MWSAENELSETNFMVRPITFRMPGGSVPAQPADIELVRRAIAGDKDAFGVIFERYHHMVYRFARAMTGSHQAAEDVTQDVFVALIRDLHRYQPERAVLSTYLYGVARNISRDRGRRDRRLFSFLSRGEAPIGPETDDPAARLAAAETGAEVRRALAKVPIKYREAIVLCDLHDLSYADAAAVLSTSIAAVRSRLHRGRHLLRQRLERPSGQS